MLSYKKINLLDLKINDDFIIQNKDEILELKSPIITYNLKESTIHLKINKYSDSHNLCMNICGYIIRLFKISKVNINCIINEHIVLNITECSKFYDENSKLISNKNLKKEGKIVCSFTCDKGKFYIKNLLLIK